MSITLVVAFIQSRLNYSNSLLFGTASYNINKLQHVVNLVARLALNSCYSSSKCLLDKLHWLQVHSRIQFKIATVTQQGTCPQSTIISQITFNTLHSITCSEIQGLKNFKIHQARLAPMKRPDRVFELN